MPTVTSRSPAVRVKSGRRATGAPARRASRRPRRRRCGCAARCRPACGRRTASPRRPGAAGCGCPGRSRCSSVSCATSCGAPSRLASAPASSTVSGSSASAGVRVVGLGDDQLELAVAVGDDPDPAPVAQREVLAHTDPGQRGHLDVHATTVATGRSDLGTACVGARWRWPTSDRPRRGQLDAPGSRFDHHRSGPPPRTARPRRPRRSRRAGTTPRAPSSPHAPRSAISPARRGVDEDVDDVDLERDVGQRRVAGLAVHGLGARVHRARSACRPTCRNRATPYAGRQVVAADDGRCAIGSWRCGSRRACAVRALGQHRRRHLGGPASVTGRGLMAPRKAVVRGA